MAWLRLRGRRLCQVLRFTDPAADVTELGCNTVPAVVGLIVPGPVVAPSLTGVCLELHGGVTHGLTILAVRACPEGAAREWQVLAEVAS